MPLWSLQQRFCRLSALTATLLTVTELRLDGGFGRTKAEAVYHVLRDHIVAGTIAPGVVLDQESLARDLGVSTTPVREALRRLEMEEFVELSAHRDARVVPLSRRELDEIFAVRLVLEPNAAQTAAKHASDEQIETLRRLTRLEPSDPLEVSAHNRTVHRLIYVASGNSVLTRILDQMYDRAGRYRLILLEKSSSHAEKATIAHREIAGAFAARDPERLGQLVYEHLLESYAHYDDVAELD